MLQQPVLLLLASLVPSVVPWAPSESWVSKLFKTHCAITFSFSNFVVDMLQIAGVVGGEGPVGTVGLQHYSTLPFPLAISLATLLGQLKSLTFNNIKFLTLLITFSLGDFAGDVVQQPVLQIAGPVGGVGPVGSVGPVGLGPELLFQLREIVLVHLGRQRRLHVALVVELRHFALRERQTVSGTTFQFV